MHIINIISAKLTILVVVLVLALESPSWSTVFWDDSFEYADQPTMAAVWDGASCVGDTTVLAPTTARFRSGAKSIQEYFTGTAPNYEGGRSCYFGGRRFPATNTLYSRWWMYLTDHTGASNFLVGSPTTKITLQFPNSCSTCFSVWWQMDNGTTNLTATYQHADGTGINYKASGNIPQRQWACVETQITAESPAGASNGVIAAWINGVQVLSRTNLTLLKSGGNGPLVQARLYTQNGLGTIYYDNYAVGDTRIGCGATSGATTPPPSPTGLTVQ